MNRFPQAAHADESFDELTSGRARLIMVHVRRATIGGLKLENTHPFTRGPYAYCHNGTILKASQLEPLADRAARRRHRLGALLQPPDDRLRLRRRDRLAAPRGRARLRHLPVLRPQLPVLRRAAPVRLPLRRLQAVLASCATSTSTPTPRRTTTSTSSARAASTSCWSPARSSPRTERWSEFGQDELLVCDPADADHPRIQRLLGDARGLGRVRAAGRRRADRRGARRVGRRARGGRLLSALGGTRRGPQPPRAAPCAASPVATDHPRAVDAGGCCARPLTRFFDRVAPGWDQRYASDPERLVPLTAALDLLPRPPARVLDVGTGTGAARC